MSNDGKPNRLSEAALQGRLQARPTLSQIPLTTYNSPIGLQVPDLATKRDPFIYIPSGYQANHPAPLAVMLHGAGGNAQRGLDLLRDFADERGIILLAPAAHAHTWDVIVNQFGPDIALIDQALTQTFNGYAVDPAHIAIGGFSDGASYALSVGLTNGDLFTHIMAFSPGFMVPAAQRGAPQIYISHGTDDTVLPIARCSRRLVPQLERAGYGVRYLEFDGPHTVPAEIASAALDWFTAKQN